MMTTDLISKAARFVESKLIESDESGHDWNHTQRVWQLTKQIAMHTKCNIEIAELGALFHDIADAKFHNGDESIGGITTQHWLSENTDNTTLIKEVTFIVNHVSYRKKYIPDINKYPELSIVQDADRLDAIGAIGIARAFSYGGFKNRPLYSMSKNGSQNTIAHFYEKLLHLKDQMNTKFGKELAEERHDFIVAFLNQFQKEVNISTNNIKNT
jgi:uncharacterized protein